MFEFEDLETADPSPINVKFRIADELVEMRVERGDMTPYELMTLWEKDWGINYATRLRFEAPRGSSAKWLNPRNSVIPPAPAVIRLDGMGSILSAVAGAIKQRFPSTVQHNKPQAKPASTVGPVARHKYKDFHAKIAEREISQLEERIQRAPVEIDEREQNREKFRQELQRSRKEEEARWEWDEQKWAQQYMNEQQSTGETSSRQGRFSASG